MQMQPFESKPESEIGYVFQFSEVEEKTPPSETAYEYAQLFECQLKAAILVEAGRMNDMNEGDMQDGFCLSHIDDGWVSYKGMSWGFVVHNDPVALDMTFGPDWPFVGHRTVMQPQLSSGRIIWTERNAIELGTVCCSAEDIARFGLRRLSERADKAA